MLLLYLEQTLYGKENGNELKISWENKRCV